MMTLSDSIKICYKKSFDPQGRASPSEFWWFQSAFFLIFLFALTDGGGYTLRDNIDKDLLVLPYFILVMLSTPALFCVAIRRWHDLGYSGWMLLLNLLPYLGTTITFFYFMQEGERQANLYGDIPSDSSDYVKQLDKIN